MFLAWTSGDHGIRLGDHTPTEVGFVSVHSFGCVGNMYLSTAERGAYEQADNCPEWGCRSFGRIVRIHGIRPHTLDLIAGIADVAAIIDEPQEDEDIDRHSDSKILTEKIRRKEVLGMHM